MGTADARRPEVHGSASRGPETFSGPTASATQSEFIDTSRERATMGESGTDPQEPEASKWADDRFGEQVRG